MSDVRESIVYTCIRRGSVLTERRSPDSLYAPGEIVFPCGKIESPDETPVHAFMREFREETAIEARCFTRLQPLDYPEDNIRLFPFVVLNWLGDLPTRVVDKGNLFIWESLTAMRQSPRLEVAQIAQLIVAFTDSN